MGTLSNLFTLTIARSQNAIEMINFREAGKKMKCLLSYLSILITGKKNKYSEEGQNEEFYIIMQVIQMAQIFHILFVAIILFIICHDFQLLLI